MKLEAHKKSWKTSVSKGDIIITLESILNQLTHNSSRINELYALIGRFNTTNRAYELGTVKYEDFSLELTRIRLSILKLIDKIREVDFDKKEDVQVIESESLSKEEIINLVESYLPKFHQIGSRSENIGIIENQILILSDKEGMYSLKSYFNIRKFKNVQFESWDNFKIHMLNEIDIVVFNNMDIPSMHSRSSTMDEKTIKRIKIIRQAIEASTCYFIHYGNFFELINEYKNRITPANSIFTLFSRVKEIADFSNTYTVYL